MTHSIEQVTSSSQAIKITLKSLCWIAYGVKKGEQATSTLVDESKLTLFVCFFFNAREAAGLANTDEVLRGHGEK